MSACKINGCDQEVRSRGWCGKHYMRWWEHGDPLHIEDRPAPWADRIRDNVEVDDNGCWRWTGAVSSDGYVNITVGSRRDGTRRTTKAHRIAYQAFVGPIPDGLTIDHRCRVRDCMNPNHLEAVTMRENTLRSPTAPTAVNARKEQCPECGSDYTEREDREGRYCRPCYLEYLREYNATRRDQGATR